MRSYLGLDIATNLGVSWGNTEDSSVSTIFYPPEDDRFNRWDQYPVALEQLIALPSGFCVVEGYGFANQYTLATLVELGTMIRENYLRKWAIPFIEVPPKT